MKVVVIEENREKAIRHFKLEIDEFKNKIKSIETIWGYRLKECPLCKEFETKSNQEE